MNKALIIATGSCMLTLKLAAQNSISFDTEARYQRTTPASYNKTFSANFKFADSIQLAGSGGAHVAFLGMRAWSDNTGGKSHEIAFAQNSNVYIRSGFDPAREKWRRLISEDVNGNVGIGTVYPSYRPHSTCGPCRK